jgi:hypothetical protein
MLTVWFGASGSGLELNGGGLASALVSVNQGGTLRGDGTLFGDLVNSASGSASVVDVGLGVGHLEVRGDYVQDAQGVLAIDITGTNSGGNHDTTEIVGDVNLGGTLQIDTSDLAAGEFVPGATYTLAEVGGTINGEFDSIEIAGRDDIYFAINYGSPAALLGEGAALDSANLITAEGYFKGDGNQDFVVDDLDAAIFAAVLIDNTLGEFRYTQDGQTRIAAANFLDAFDFYSQGAPAGYRLIDFDDVTGFAEMLAGHQRTSLASAYRTIEAALEAARHSQVPEPGTLLLALLLTVASIGGLRARPS